jgi:RNA polymerase sigma-70 factor, ECF subfamily
MRLRYSSESGFDAQFSLEEDLLSLKQASETLEQRVAHLYETLRLPVYYYLLAFLGNAAEASDLTQEAFLRLYRALHKGGSVHQVRLWVFRVAHNLAFDERQRRQRLESLDAPGWEGLRNALPDAAPGQEQQFIQQEQMRRLQKALPRLSMQEQQCLLLRAEGFRYHEIGEILNLKTATVSGYLHRAVRKLTESMNE